MSVDKPILIPQIEDLLMGPKMENPPLIEKGKLRLLAWIISGKSFLQKEFQRTLQSLLQVPKGKVITHYESAWGKWDSWCNRKQVDPISGRLNSVLDFLAELFHSGLEWSTSPSYRSSISAFHDPIEGFSVGKHPRVCSLLKGIFNERPPIPRYTFIWNVQKVLTYLST